MTQQFSNATRALFGPFQTAEDLIKATVLADEELSAQYKALRHERDVEDRPPRVIPSKQLFFGTLAVIGTVEAVGEALTFMSGSDGLIMAILTALVVTPGTQGCGAGIGLLWRYTHLKNLSGQPNRRRNNQAWAWPAILGLAMVAIVITGTAAVFKDASAAGDVMGVKDIAVYARDHTGDVSLSSFVMIAIALVSAAITAWKVASAVDREPGYAKAFERKEAARAKRADLKNSLRGQVEAVSAVEIEGVVNAARAELAVLTGLRRQAKAFILAVERVKQRDGEDIAAGVAAIKHARTLNLRVRGDGLSPTCLTAAPDLSDLVLDAEWPQLSARIETAITAQTAKIARLEQASEGERARVHLIKEHTDRLMLAIAKAPEPNKVPELAEVKALMGFATGSDRQLGTTKETSDVAA